MIGCVQNDFWAYGMFGSNNAAILHWHKHYLQIERNEIPHDACHLGVPSGVSKMIFKPLVCLAQTVHQSCVKISTISKQTDSSFHFSLVTYEYNLVCLKWFLNLCNIWRKPCTNLPSILALSTNGLNRASTWASSPMSNIGCVQNDLWAYGTFGTNSAPILRRH
jgi:hypothetical protein